MQTFLPYSCFTKSAKCLDYRRLGKQRVEARQILKAIDNGGAWANHPAVKMWNGYESALAAYSNEMILEWISRGYKNTMQIVGVSDSVVYPPWFGDEKFHASHRSNLLRKDFGYYSRFSWSEPVDLEYVWPSKDKEIASKD